MVRLAPGRGPGGRPLITYNVDDHDVARLKRAVEIMSRVYFAAGARSVFPMIHGFDELRDPPFTPVTPPRLLLGPEGKESDLFAAIRGGALARSPIRPMAQAATRRTPWSLSERSFVSCSVTAAIKSRLALDFKLT